MTGGPAVGASVVRASAVEAPVAERPAAAGPVAEGQVTETPVTGGRAAAGPVAGGPELAARVVALLAERGLSVAVAESLTGGLLGAALTAVPGASAVFRGGIIAYATELKAVLLGVPEDLLARHGAVHPEVAAAMAAGARVRLGASAGLATTGVAGPDPAEGKPPGTVHIAASVGGRAAVRALALSGDRASIRRDTVDQCLRLLWELLAEEAG